jgi:hypothetical protein
MYLSLFATVVGSGSLIADDQRGGTVQCRPAGGLTAIAGLTEGSGAAASRRFPGHLWTHNDSGQPMLFLVSDSGAVTRRVQVTGAVVEDWEAVAVGKCPTGTCIFVGDIGDNNANRKRITIYRVPEPDGTATATAEAFHATYPDGPHDAETLLLSPGGDMFVVTKGETGPLGAYRFPRDMRPGATVRLESIGVRGGKVDAEERITDGAISPNGAWVVLRTNDVLSFYPADDFLAGKWNQPQRLSIAQLGEPQGEGVTFADDKTLYLVGEGGVRGGTFVRVNCEMPAK